MKIWLLWLLGWGFVGVFACLSCRGGEYLQAIVFAIICLSTAVWGVGHRIAETIEDKK